MVALAITLMAEAGYAQNTVSVSDTANFAKVALVNDIDLNKLPDADAKAEHLVEAASIPPAVVSRTMVLISRASSFAYARVHALGTFARPPGVQPEVGTRDGILERVAKVIGLDTSSSDDRSKLYWFMKSIYWVAHAGAQTSAYRLNGSMRNAVKEYDASAEWLLMGFAKPAMLPGTRS